MLGIGVISGNGNNLANLIRGNAENSILWGNDTFGGGMGNDV